MNTWSAGASALQVTTVFLILSKNIFFLSGARYNCAGTFDERTCECECKGEMFQDMEKVTNLRSKYPSSQNAFSFQVCNSQPGSEWDPDHCMCKHEVNKPWIRAALTILLCRAWCREEWTPETSPVRRTPSTLQHQDLTQVSKGHNYS